MADPKAVARARQLLKMRAQGGDASRTIAIEKQLKQFPPDVLALATADEVGDLHREVGKEHQETAALAIRDEIKAYVDAVTQGHKSGYAQFREWYKGWKRAQEESIAKDFAEAFFSFILEVGLDIVFPEGGELVEEAAKIGENVMKQAVKAGLETGFKALTPKGKSESLEDFLDKVLTKEEADITKLLDISDKFMQSKAGTEAINSFVAARNDEKNPWESVTQLPPKTLTILRSNGIGPHGSGAADETAERVLNVHIRAAMDTEYAPDEKFGTLTKRDLEKMELVQTLKQTGESSRKSGAKVRGDANTELAWEADQQTRDGYKTMVDINHVDAMTIHTRLKIDLDDANAIIESRHTVGQFGHPHDLVRRELISEETFAGIEAQVVAHRG